MSRTFVTSDGVSTDALQKNEKFLLDNYILKNKTIPIELFGDNVTIAIGEAITFLTNNGGGAVHIPAQGSTFDLEIRVFKDRSGTFHTQYIYNYDRYPTVESRPYSGGDWKVGDTIINTQPTVDKCLGWVCSANGTPGTWTPFGWCKTWFSEIEQVESLPDPSVLQANRQLVYGGKVCYCMLVNGEYKWVHPVDGVDGHTPEKGVDYWTASDIQGIVEDVLEAMPNGDEVSY